MAENNIRDDMKSNRESFMSTIIKDIPVEEKFLEFKKKMIIEIEKRTKCWPTEGCGGMLALIAAINAQSDCVVTWCVPSAARLLMHPLREERSADGSLLPVSAKRRRSDWTAPFSSIMPFEPDQFLARVDPALGDLLFTTDPPEITTVCTTLEKAVLLLKIVIGAGFAESGLSVDGNGRFALTLRGTSTLRVPLCEDSVMLVSQIYLMFLTDMANDHLRSSNFQLRNCATVMLERLSSTTNSS